MVELLSNGLSVDDVIRMFSSLPRRRVEMIKENLELFKRLVEAMRLVEIDREKLAGMPVVRGTRVPVAVVYELLDGGFKPEDIVKMFPTLRLSDVVELASYSDVLKPIMRDIWRRLIERPQEVIECLL